MSGNRSVHRQQINADESAIWSIQATTPFRLWTADSTTSEDDGKNDAKGSGSSSSRRSVLRVHQCLEAGGATGDAVLSASALQVTPSHTLHHKHHDAATASSSPVQGCCGTTRVCTVRNYIGDDINAGDLVVVSLDLSGHVGVWTFTSEWEQGQVDATMTEANVQRVPCLSEFIVPNATGTSVAIAPPSVVAQSVQEVVAAVGCLDGTISLVATGISTPNAKKEASAAGTILDTWGTNGSAIPLCLSWHPVQAETLVAGRQNGLIDILSSAKENRHKLSQFCSTENSPVRAVAYTPDGNLLIAGNDAGTICVWDVHKQNGSSAPALVNHVVQAHMSWILDVACVSDSRRFVTCGAEQKIHVWNVGQLAQGPLHTFQLDSPVWTMALLQGRGRDEAPRLVTGSENGWLQVFSLES